jgi:hypothetical protein
MKAGRASTGIFVASCALACVGAAAEELPARQVTVDATVTTGMLRPFSGVQAADAGGTAFYRAAHIDLVRIHDVAGAADIGAIFPDMSADPEDPKAYRFGPTDQLVASIKTAGAEPLFDLYGAADGAAGPADVDKWSRIVKHVVLHYNAGWNKGFHYHIRYWEVWNAPDAQATWSGSAQDYYALYEKAVQAIQSADDSALIGAPALSRPLLASPYRDKFFDFVRMRRLPLDFFTWHFFAVDSNDPLVFVSIARQLRTNLDSHGFGSTRSVLDEWGADPQDKEISPAGRAAFAASSLIYMLGGPIDSQTYFRADTALRDAGGDSELTGQVLKIFGSLKSTPQLVRTTGGDESGFAVIAARSPDKRVLQIVISNYQVPAKTATARGTWDTSLPERRTLQYRDNGGYDATVAVPTDGKYQVKRYRIGESANLILVDQSVQNGPSLHLQAALAACR